jgi:hypothetical protein
MKSLDSSRKITIAKAYRSVRSSNDDIFDFKKDIINNKYNILMPDIKLCQPGEVFPRGSVVISWLVDDLPSLISALDMGVAGVVSNRPVAMLEALKGLHKTYCPNSQ